MTPLPDTLLEAVASAAVREGLADAVFTRLASPIGRLLVVQGPEGIVRVGFEDEREDAALAAVARALGPRVVASDRELAGTRDALSAYLEGDEDRLELPVDLRLVGAPFRRAVLETLHDEVPHGETVTYGALAARSGRPRAFRAAATACARNPVPIVVPCHRVLPAGGGIGNYGGGVARKRALLRLEGSLPRG
jgi:methylated-DNA-[protein]-cysteine S-methyltransferase